MLKPSRFASHRLPINIYSDKSINKFKLDDRFLVSKTIFCEDRYNFHFGIDIKEKEEVMVTSILASQYNHADQISKGLEYLASEMVWSKGIIIKKIKYIFRVHKKKGILIQQLLNSLQKIQVAHLYYIFINLIQFVSRIQKLKANIKQLSIRSVQIVQNTPKKDFNLQLINIWSLQPKLIKSVSNKPTDLGNRLQIIKITSSNEGRKSCISGENNHYKQSNKRDYELILEWVANISSEFVINYANQQQKQQFNCFLKLCSQQVQKNQGKNYEILIKWNNQIKRICQKNKIQLSQIKEDINFIIRSRKLETINQIEKICQQLENKSKSSQFGSENDFQFQISQLNEVDHEAHDTNKIANLIQQHTFYVKTKEKR